VDLAGGVRWERLTPTSDSNVSFLFVTYGVGGASSPPDALMQHSGREFGVVLEGSLGARIGDQTYDLGPGDSVAFDCSTPHRFWTVGQEPAVVVWAVVGPTES
jgi:mannose-6-phosphate isomerase-like protein (cupin superfamily)